jgi:hypothetical protein
MLIRTDHGKAKNLRQAFFENELKGNWCPDFEGLSQEHLTQSCPCGDPQCHGSSCEAWSEYWKAMDLWWNAKPNRPELCERPSQSPNFIGITHGDPMKIALIAEIEAKVKEMLPEGTILVDTSYIDPEASFYTECHGVKGPSHPELVVFTSLCVQSASGKWASGLDLSSFAVIDALAQDLDTRFVALLWSTMDLFQAWAPNKAWPWYNQTLE